MINVKDIRPKQLSDINSYTSKKLEYIVTMSLTTTTTNLHKVWYIQPGFSKPTEVEIEVDHQNLTKLCHASPISCVMFSSKDGTETYTIWFDDYGMSNETKENENICAERMFSRIRNVWFGTFHGYFVITKSRLMNDSDDDGSGEPESYVDMDMKDEDEFVEFCNNT